MKLLLCREERDKRGHVFRVFDNGGALEYVPKDCTCSECLKRLVRVKGGAVKLAEITRLEARVAELEEFIGHQAQKVHQGYHGYVDYLWRECPMEVCASARTALWGLMQSMRWTAICYCRCGTELPACWPYELCKDCLPKPGNGE